MTIIERARRYVAAMPAAVSGAGGHSATFAVACVLVKGFDLPLDTARALLSEYNGRCEPAWSVGELEHKLREADKIGDAQPRGYLLGDRRGEMGSLSDGTGSDRSGNRVGSGGSPRREVPRPVYDESRLRDFAGGLAREVDLVWLANRSAVDPAEVGSGAFLDLLFRSDEKILAFTEVNRDGNPCSQGEAVWPGDGLPVSGRCGVWYLGQPVDGEYHLNPRSGKLSRRSEESVTRWPHVLLESDDAPVREWLGALARLPLKIVAIYSSGGRSVHALVRINATTKGQWDDLVKGQMAPGLRFLILNGADKGVFSAVRLTRLPGAWREGKMREGNYVRFARPELQKLLYVNPDANGRPLCEMPVVRDVEGTWCDLAARGAADEDVSGGRWIGEGLGYYARASARCREALRGWLSNGQD